MIIALVRCSDDVKWRCPATVLQRQAPLGDRRRTSHEDLEVTASCAISTLRSASLRHRAMWSCALETSTRLRNLYTRQNHTWCMYNSPPPLTTPLTSSSNSKVCNQQLSATFKSKIVGGRSPFSFPSLPLPPSPSLPFLLYQVVSCN